MSLLARAVFVFVLISGVIGGTVAAANESLPGSSVYPLKLALEDARLSMAADPAHQALLHLSFAEERVEEIVSLADSGVVAGEETIERLQNHLEASMLSATQLSDEQLLEFLLDAQEMLQHQEQLMMQVEVRTSMQLHARLREAGEILTRARNHVETGLQEPSLFRHSHGQDKSGDKQWSSTRVPSGSGVITATVPLTLPHSYGPGPGFGPGPEAGTPQCPDCEANQQQNQNGSGPGHQGNMPDCLECDQTQEQNQQNGVNMPGGNDNHHGGWGEGSGEGSGR